MVHHRSAVMTGLDPRGASEECDVVVVGGGPGGSTTAARLAQRGRTVILLERQFFPRFHIGESLLPASTPLLRELGLEAELDRRYVRKHSARFLDDGVPDPFGAGAGAQYVFAEAFPPSTPHAWQVTRADFDELLLRNAQRLGVVVREGWRALSAVEEGSTIVGLDAADPSGAIHRIRAKVVVDATGREGFLSRRGKERIAGLDKTAVFSQFQGGLRNPGRDAGQIEIIILAGKNEDGATPGWGWYIPFLDGRSSAGFVLSSEVVRRDAPDLQKTAEAPSLGHPREYEPRPREASERLEAIFGSLVARSTSMRTLLQDAPRIEPVRAAADYSFRVRELAGNGWLAVGDSTGFIDPLFSTGAHLAIGGGDRAARAIDEALRDGDVAAHRFADYEKIARKAADLFLGAVQSFYRGELREMLFARDQRSVIRRMVTSMLAGDVFHDEGDTPLWVPTLRERFPLS
jgi:flavin-dependent dehydrogenase